MAPPVKSGPRFNQMINVPKVRVIDENGENLGVMYTREAIDQAAEVGLGRESLVVSSNRMLPSSFAPVDSIAWVVSSKHLV